MRTIRNLLAIVGLATILAAGYLLYATRDFDPAAYGVYRDFAVRLLETGDLADAFVWAEPVAEGLSAKDVKESMKSLAVERNFLFVNESPFYKQAAAVTGKDFRHVSFMQFCDVQVGIEMLDHNNAYSAFMPCGVSVVEDSHGKLWLYALNMDFMIHGAKELPPELKRKALRVRQTMREIMKGAASGEF
ncbi:MAG: DUF302 domain-containing protein [Gammaproteobacteria bacterium]|nr:DUF302 domain-containing protein [Gammaproteobacteria bacterium]HXK55318.1 DUF302 domain-containing protein [Gammaproteobacteria bacterium]